MTSTTEQDTRSTEAEVVRDLAAAAGNPVVTTAGRANVVSVLVPDGYSVETVDHRPYEDQPPSATGVFTPKDVASFERIVERHVSDRTTIWVEAFEGRVVAVLNDHGARQDPHFGDLRADLRLPETPEWKHWASHDGTLFKQVEFAEHIEDGIDQIISPAGAELYEIATTFQAKGSSDFRSAVRLNDGSISFAWTEDVTATAGRDNNLTIPDTIELSLSPFYGEAPFAVKAKLRYRTGSGGLRIGYKLDRPDRVVKTALETIQTRLEEKWPGQVFIGTAPSARTSGR